MIVFNPCKLGLPFTFSLLNGFLGSITEYSLTYEKPDAPDSMFLFLSFLIFNKSSKTISTLFDSGQIASGVVSPIELHQEEVHIRNNYQ